MLQVKYRMLHDYTIAVKTRPIAEKHGLYMPSGVELRPNLTETRNPRLRS
jgi:hypothetical protein